MTMVTPTRGMAYTVIPLDRLNEIRSATHQELKKISEKDGKTYTIRTFYLGKRKYRIHRVNPKQSFKVWPASTPRRDATGAKIAIYEKVKVTKDWGSYTQNNLIAYV